MCVCRCLPQYLPSDYPDLCNVFRNRQSQSGSVLRILHLTRLDRADRPRREGEEEKYQIQINDGPGFRVSVLGLESQKRRTARAMDDAAYCPKEEYTIVISVWIFFGSMVFRLCEKGVRLDGGDGARLGWIYVYIEMDRFWLPGGKPVVWFSFSEIVLMEACVQCTWLCQVIMPSLER